MDLGASFDPTTVAAVVFDIGGVFLYPSYKPVQQRQLELGLDPSNGPDDYRRAHHQGCAALSASILATQGNSGPGDEGASDFWSKYDNAYLGALGLSGEQVELCRDAVRTSWDWPHEANITAFHRLAGLGLPLAIVSNNDGSAEPSMQEFGVCQVGQGPLPTVVAIVDSAILGIAKPDPAIMAPALAALDQPTEHVLYVGDTVHADVVGATNAGMQVVQLDPFDQHGDYSHRRLVDLDELTDLLGAGRV